MNPLLSIVIPTKNRYEYLEILIETLLLNNSTKFELVIQDNSDDNSDFLEFAEKYKTDIRFKYNHTLGWLSVIDNCDLAVNAAIGDYVCMLGDDDGILIDRSLELVRYLIEHDIDAIVPNLILYTWPDIDHAHWQDTLSGRVITNPFSNKITLLDNQKELKKVLKHGAAYGVANLARIYQGIVSKVKLDALKNETGTYFPGPSPDMANAVGLSKYIEQSIYVDKPSIITGHSRKSTAGQGGKKEHHGNIKAQTHLPKDTSEKWSKKIPFFWSGPTIYAESARRALLETNRSGALLDYHYLYATCLVYEKEYKKLVLSLIINNRAAFNTNAFRLISVLAKIVKVIFYRGINYLKNIAKFRKLDNSYVFVKIFRRSFT